MAKSGVPTWLDGEAANLAAAASDAREWLYWLRDALRPDGVLCTNLEIPGINEARCKVAGCINALSEQLAPLGEDVFLRSRAFPYAVAEIIALSPAPHRDTDTEDNDGE